MNAESDRRGTVEGGVRIDALRAHLAAAVGRPVALVETHVSWVLLDGEHAWKIKKPVTLGFLDFSHLDVRRECCEAELRLNRRLAPELYLDVAPIRGEPHAPRFDGQGAAIEYAVRMRQFASGALFSERLAAGTLDAEAVERFALRLAAFQLEAPSADALSPWGSAERVRADTALALDGIAAAASSSSAWVAAMRERFEAKASRLARVFEARKRQGWIREGHGDLHLANVVVLDAQVTAFDCIEFDPGLRWIDVQNDAAFLAMDLLAHERADLAFRFLDAWLGALGDYEGLVVLRYYLAYRAVVRELVASIRGRQRGDVSSGPRYAGLASQLLESRQPRLLITNGVSGSGKSYAAARLLERCGAIRIRSDLERKRLHGVGALARSNSSLDAGIYAADASTRTYDRLHDLAEISLQAGWPTIVDATFLRAADRERFRELAERLDVPFSILACEAVESVLRERIEARLARGADPSEADLRVLERQLAGREPLLGNEQANAIVVDTSRGPLDVASIARAWRGATA
ncbi:MAG: AAA family ATPase [Burkholderiaceae bacterium]|nr:AAA family ATPase [Burkholderiaceae bacterium]